MKLISYNQDGATRNAEGLTTLSEGTVHNNDV